jgi:UrcA family protein
MRVRRAGRQAFVGLSAACRGPQLWHWPKLQRPRLQWIVTSMLARLPRQGWLNARCAAASALFVIGVAASGAAIAADEIHELTVTAPEVSRQKVGRASNGAPVDLIAVTHRVNYDDLDLSKSADAAKLEARIKVSAERACAELKKLVRFEEVDPKCVQQATEKAMAQETAAIASARRR